MPGFHSPLFPDTMNPGGKKKVHYQYGWSNEVPSLLYNKLYLSLLFQEFHQIDTDLLLKFKVSAPDWIREVCVMSRKLRIMNNRATNITKQKGALLKKKKRKEGQIRSSLHVFAFSPWYIIHHCPDWTRWLTPPGFTLNEFQQPLFLFIATVRSLFLRLSSITCTPPPETRRRSTTWALEVQKSVSIGHLIHTRQLLIPLWFYSLCFPWLIFIHIW